jgi:DNA-binding Lrp family transcriptional regulator
VRDRLQRLERDGVISGYHAALDPQSVHTGTAAFVALRFEEAAGVVKCEFRLRPSAGICEPAAFAMSDGAAARLDRT